MTEIFSIQIFSVVLTLLAFQFGLWLQRKFKAAILNPIIIAAIIIIIFLSVFNIEIKTFQSGSALFSWLLTPATVCLAIPMYSQFVALKNNLPAIIVGVTVGTLSTLVSLVGLFLFFELESVLSISLLPKGITTAMAVPLAEMYGGVPAITTLAVVVSGILGNIFGASISKLLKITNPIAQGVAYGTASHVVGTAKATEIDPVCGAVSSLSLVIAGVLTAVFYPVFALFV